MTGADSKPIVLVFVHDVNRQTISMTRILTNYTLSRSKEGLHTAVVLLAEDTTGALNTLKRIQHALTANVPTGVSPDGLEGPGNYGLNRSVQMTILVANKNRVTANFALIQPSLQVDLPNVVPSRRPARRSRTEAGIFCKLVEWRPTEGCKAPRMPMRFAAWSAL